MQSTLKKGGICVMFSRVDCFEKQRLFLLFCSRDSALLFTRVDSIIFLKIYNTFDGLYQLFFLLMNYVYNPWYLQRYFRKYFYRF